MQRYARSGSTEQESQVRTFALAVFGSSKPRTGAALLSLACVRRHEVPLSGIGKSKANERRLAGGHVSYCTTGTGSGPGSLWYRGEVGCRFVVQGVARWRDGSEARLTVGGPTATRSHVRSRSLRPGSGASRVRGHLSSGTLLAGAFQARHSIVQTVCDANPADMDFLKSAVASAISKGPAFGYTFGDRVDLNDSIWTLHNGTKRVWPECLHAHKQGQLTWAR
jgi:hypothetical protein